MLNPVLLFNNIIMLIQQHEDKPSLLSVNPGLIIWTIVIFILLLLLLRKIAWKPLLTALNNREESIKNAIENAEKLNADAQRLIEENKKNLAEANAQSMKIINESKEMANKVREEMISKANADARKIVDQAQSDIEHQKDAALNELRDKISDIAVKAAEKIIQESLDETKQKKIVSDFLTQVPKN